MIVLLKTLHLAALIIWCAALLALPLSLKWHDPVHDRGQNGRLHRLTQGTYTWLATPAAVLAIGTGTGLMFARSLFEPWMFAKLLAVALMVALHARVGLVLEDIEEADGHPKTPGVAWLSFGAALSMSAVLLLVLAKPTAPADLSPDWLATPRDQPLPVPEPPRR